MDYLEALFDTSLREPYFQQCGNLRHCSMLRFNEAQSQEP